MEFFSCNNGKDIESFEASEFYENFVEQRVAVAIASMIEFPVNDEGMKTRADFSPYREIDTVIPFGDPYSHPIIL